MSLANMGVVERRRGTISLSEERVVWHGDHVWRGTAADNAEEVGLRVKHSSTGGGEHVLY